MWAVTSGIHPLNIGRLRISEAGNGGLEFARPEQAGTYSLVVNAESNALVRKPGGPVILWSGARQARAYFGRA